MKKKSIIKEVLLFCGIFAVVFGIVVAAAGMLPDIASAHSSAELPIVGNRGNFILSIPALQEQYPISVSGAQTSTIYAGLQRGVVMVKSSEISTAYALTHKAVILGHSSEYPWANGQYNYAFAHLDQLQKGDGISVSYQGEVYHYTVSATYFLLPGQASTLNTDPQNLYLATCWPVGFNSKRLVVAATLDPHQLSQQ